MIGQTIAHYEILDKLGAGGMGIVYRGRDTRLDRDVAIKALPEDFASDPEGLARFEGKNLSTITPQFLKIFNHYSYGAIQSYRKNTSIAVSPLKPNTQE